jgi:hypothetical protein
MMIDYVERLHVWLLQEVEHAGFEGCVGLTADQEVTDLGEFFLGEFKLVAVCLLDRMKSRVPRRQNSTARCLANLKGP